MSILQVLHSFLVLVIILIHEWSIGGYVVQVPMSRVHSDLFPVMNITIGTPPQYFRVAVSFYQDTDLEVLSVSATGSTAKNRSGFNASASTTYRQIQDFTSSKYGTGPLGEDLLGIEGTMFNISFSLLAIGYSWPQDNVDGFLGLSLKTYAWAVAKNNTLVKQLEKYLDSPIISVWKQEFMLNEDNVSYVMTLGAHDTTNCENQWISVPRVKAPNCYGSKWISSLLAPAVHLNSITTTFRGTDVRIALNKTLVVDYACMDGPAHLYTHGSMPYYMQFFLANALKGKMSDDNFYTVDCDAEIAGNLVLHLDDWLSDKNMSLNGADLTSRYVTKDVNNVKWQSDTCILPISGNTDDNCDTICLPNMAWNNHCYSYNFVKNEMGFSNAVKIRRSL